MFCYLIMITGVNYVKVEGDGRTVKKKNVNTFVICNMLNVY